MEGYDFGVRNRTGVIGDFAYIEDWDKSGYFANGYGIYPQHGVIFNAPFLAMIFEDEGIGRRLFSEHFMKWVQSSGSGDAIDISFVEWNDGSYTMGLAPNIEYLVKRTLPNVNDEEVEILPMVLSKFKEFPNRSKYFMEFKRMARTNPVLFVPADRNMRVMDDLLIVKYKINFLNEGNAADDWIGEIMLRNRKLEKGRYEAPIPLEDYQTVSKRRNKMMKKYFPITLERIYVSEKYKQVSSSLQNNEYAEWQIQQGFCNLVLSKNRLGLLHYSPSQPELSDGSKKNKIIVYDLLKDYSERPRMDDFSDELFDFETLQRQIVLDSIELLRMRDIKMAPKENPEIIQNKMAENHLL
jgi:hypothetical protein